MHKVHKGIQQGVWQDMRQTASRPDARCGNMWDKGQDIMIGKADQGYAWQGEVQSDAVSSDKQDASYGRAKHSHAKSKV